MAGLNMNIVARDLQDLDGAAYDSLLERATGATFFHSRDYLELLQAFLPHSIQVLVACSETTTIGALPVAVAQNDRFGTVVNALPFFGSSAGVVVDSTTSTATTAATYQRLLDAATDTAGRGGSVLATVITSQFDPHNEQDSNPRYEEAAEPIFHRDRVAQIVDISDAPHDDLVETGAPPDETPSDPAAVKTLEEYLFMKFEKRCRRAIRKSYSAGLSRSESTDFRPLYEMHKAGMEAKGGTVKPYEFFELVPEHVPEDRYSLMYAEKDEEVVAGLLTFEHNGVIEYHTPAYDYEHRSDQGTSFLIFEAMKDAVYDELQYWNFGGTQPSQESLYRFKRGWGAVEYPYHYYGIVKGDISTIKRASPGELSEAFPWFYVYPFDELERS